VFARKVQRRLCHRIGCDPQYVDGSATLGVAPALFGSDWPIMGIRHRPLGGVCGWYVWTGEFSPDPDFFQPSTAERVWDARPEVAGYLGLPPGWGFVIAPGYEDVWQDATLLSV
jgi:hypothetical protein